MSRSLVAAIAAWAALLTVAAVNAASAQLDDSDTPVTTTTATVPTIDSRPAAAALTEVSELLVALTAAVNNSLAASTQNADDIAANQAGIATNQVDIAALKRRISALEARLAATEDATEWPETCGSYGEQRVSESVEREDVHGVTHLWRQRYRPWQCEGKPVVKLGLAETAVASCNIDWHNPNTYFAERWTGVQELIDTYAASGVTHSCHDTTRNTTWVWDPATGQWIMVGGSRTPQPG